MTTKLSGVELDTQLTFAVHLASAVDISTSKKLRLTSPTFSDTFSCVSSGIFQLLTFHHHLRTLLPRLAPLK